MLSLLSKYVVAILGTLLVVSVTGNIINGWLLKNARDSITQLETELGVVAGLSMQQEVRVVEAKQIEERVKVVVRDKIKVVKEYEYDQNKSDCSNAISVMRSVF